MNDDDVAIVDEDDVDGTSPPPLPCPSCVSPCPCALGMAITASAIFTWHSRSSISNEMVGVRVRVSKSIKRAVNQTDSPSVSLSIVRQRISQ